MFLDRKSLQSSPSTRSYRVLSKSLSADSSALLLAVHTLGGSRRVRRRAFGGVGDSAPAAAAGKLPRLNRTPSSSSLVQTWTFMSDGENEVFPLHNVLLVLCALIICGYFVNLDEKQMT